MDNVLKNKVAIYTQLGNQEFILDSKCRFGKILYIINADNGKTGNLVFKIKERGLTFKIGIIVIGKGDSLINLKLKIVHLSPDSQSELVIRSVLSEKVKFVLDSVLEVPALIRNVSAGQNSRHLLISSQAIVECCPVLLVGNNEIDARHATTISEMDESQLYYLQSRGLDYIDSKRIIALGFLSDMVNEFYDDRQANPIKRKLFSLLNNLISKEVTYVKKNSR